MTQKKSSVHIKILLRLFFIGCAAQAIYLIYIVAFPLISNTQAGGPAADLEILMRDFRWFAPVYAIGIVLLYYLFWQAITLTRQLPDQPPFKLFIVTFGFLQSFTLVWLYPITANDLFRYVVRGRVWAVYGKSPMLFPPNAFPNDPYLAFAGEFGDWVSGYGPLWEIIVQIPLRLGAVDMVPGTVSLKLVALLFYLLGAILLGWLAHPQKSTALTAMTFFAWNPLILMQGPGNGHNDMVFMALMLLGLIFWERRIWWAAGLALSLSALAKAPAALMLPLFGVILLREQATWRARLLKGAVAVVISLLTAYLVYRVLGPINETLTGVTDMLTTRRGFAIASLVRMILREIIPWDVAETVPRATGRYIFILFYLWLLWQLWRHKFNLVTAGFLVYFSQLMLGRTFRIWYPMWLIPLAALHLTPATFWRTTLFGLTAELSIINYFVVWRWWLRDLPWERLGLRTVYYYWPVMHALTVPWLFGIPLFGPIFLRLKTRTQPDHPPHPQPNP